MWWLGVEGIYPPWSVSLPPDPRGCRLRSQGMMMHVHMYLQAMSGITLRPGAPASEQEGGIVPRL